MGWLRCSFGQTNTVCLVDSWLPFAKDNQTMRLTEKMSKEDLELQYWVFSFPSSYLDINGKTFSITPTFDSEIKSLTTSSFDEALDEYKQWGEADAQIKNIDVAIGMIGKDEAKL